jgi:hypothetical protein
VGLHAYMVWLEGDDYDYLDYNSLYNCEHFHSRTLGRVHLKVNLLPFYFVILSVALHHLFSHNHSNINPNTPHEAPTTPADTSIVANPSIPTIAN